jgi:hypothetical protein
MVKPLKGMDDQIFLILIFNILSNSVADPRFSIPDPTFFYPGSDILIPHPGSNFFQPPRSRIQIFPSQIRRKEFKYFICCTLLSYAASFCSMLHPTEFCLALNELRSTLKVKCPPPPTPPTSHHSYADPSDEIYRENLA